MSELLRDIERFGLPVGSVVTLLAFQLASTAMELAGLAALVPVFQFVQADGNLTKLVAENSWWSTLVRAYNAIGLDVSLAVLLLTSMTALLVRQGFVFARLRYQAALKEGLVARQRAEGFRRFIAATTDYQDNDDGGRVVNDLTTELDRAVHYVLSSVTLIGIGIIFAIYVCALLSISIPLTGVAILVFGLAGIALRGQLIKTEKASKEVVKANQAMSEFLVARLKTTRLIRLSGMEDVETSAMARLTDQQRQRMVRIFNLLANLEIIVEPIVVAAALVFLYVSVTYAKLPLEFVGLFLVLIMRLLPVLKEAARTRQSKRGLKASFVAVANRLDEMSEAREQKTGTRPLNAVNNSIDFRDVVFSYQHGRAAPALNHLSCTLEASKLTAIVGPSGAGKSTLFDMIPRLRRPTSGQILIDGIDIAEFDLVGLRRQIAYAPQTPQVFNVTLEEHIRYGKSDATHEEVVRAAQLANIAGFIEALPNQYQTMAGDGGNALSGGQRQRLDLARALVRQAPILLLDEPTSNLDADSEALFREALMRIRSETQITILVIAHRLSTVVLADEIVVLQDGRVISKGTHYKLLNKQGWYAEAFAKQGGLEVVEAATV